MTFESSISEFSGVKMACGKHVQNILLSEEEITKLEVLNRLVIKVTCETCSTLNQVTITKSGDKIQITTAVI